MPNFSTTTQKSLEGGTIKDWNKILLSELFRGVWEITGGGGGGLLTEADLSPSHAGLLPSTG